LGQRWDAVFYIFWGEDTGLAGTDSYMNSVETLGHWSEVPGDPTTTDFSLDDVNLLQLCPVLGIVDAPPFIMNGEEYIDEPPDPQKATKVVFGVEAQTKSSTSVSMKVGPYVETGEKSPLKLELNRSVTAEIGKETSAWIEYEDVLFRSLSGRVQVFYLAPKLEVHTVHTVQCYSGTVVQWYNPNATTSYMYPVQISGATKRCYRFDP
jgi:hypothetical protein